MIHSRCDITSYNTLIYLLSWKIIVYIVELEIAASKAKNQIAIVLVQIFLSFASQLFRYP